MSNEELRTHVHQPTPQIKIAAGIWILGMMMIVTITIMWLLTALWAETLYEYTKSARDAAGPGSQVLSKLGNIRATNAWLLPLEILGISSFLCGFGFAFANILRNIRLRGATLSAVLPTLKERKPRS